MTELLYLINSNQGLIMLALLLLQVEIRVHLKNVFRRLDKLEDD